MAQQIVYISNSQTSPNPVVVKPGDSVLFTLQGRTDRVTVDFGSSTPFAQSEFPLDGSNHLMAQHAETVVAGASGSYRFTCLPTAKGTDPSQHPDPPGTVSGDLDVSSDEHEEPSPGGG